MELAMDSGEKRRTFDCDQVQDPPKGLFTSDDIKWFSCTRRGPTVDRLEAWIPLARLKDFIKGEESRVQYQCSFSILSTKVQGKTGKVVRRYWCSYGPKDERTPAIDNWADLQETAKLSGKKGRGPGSRPAALTVKVGLSMRRGCRCHFQTITDSKKEEAVLISWIERRHVDSAGEVCHGILCASAGISNAQMAPKLSKECIQFVERLLRTRVPPAEILAEHQHHIADVVRNSSGGDSLRWSRDMHLTSVDIRNIQTRLRRQGQIYHHDDAHAVRQWTERYPQHVLHYMEQSRKEDQPFCIVVSTPWMLRNLAKYGHNGAVCVDATHGTNLYGFQLFTWVVYDKHQNGLPVVWALLERHRSKDLITVQEKIKISVESSHGDLLKPDGKFQPSCFLCDDSQEEKASIRVVFPGTPIDLFIWHVRCAFNKNLTSKVQHPVHRAVMNRELGKVMYTKEPDPREVLDNFLTKWKDVEPSFVRYFEEQWKPKIEEWVISYRTHRRSNQNTTGAVEKWHATLKAHIRSSRMSKAMRKLSWLLVLLTTTIELYFWNISELKFQGRIRNRVVEDTVVTVCVKAQSIPDSYMQTIEEDGVTVRMCQSGSHPDVFYTISDWGSVEGQCTCPYSTLGNLCKHEVKCLLMDGFTQTEIVKVLGRKFGAECGGPENLTQRKTEEISHDGLPEEPEFHFPFVDFQQSCPNEVEKVLSVDDILTEVKKFDRKLESDQHLLSVFFIRVKEAMEDVLKLQAKMQTNTSRHDDASHTVPHPLELPADADVSSALERKKSWYETMMDQYSKKRKQSRSWKDLVAEDVPIPLERVVKPPWRPLDEEFDAEALQLMLGGGNTGNRSKRRSNRGSRTKIGSQSSKPRSRDAPRFPKPKEEGWWLLVGDPKTNQLLAIKRVALQRKARVKLKFTSPSEPGRKTYTLYFMCDAYLGCDQEYPVTTDVKESVEEEEEGKPMEE